MVVSALSPASLYSTSDLYEFWKTNVGFILEGWGSPRSGRPLYRFVLNLVKSKNPKYTENRRKMAAVYNQRLRAVTDGVPSPLPIANRLVQISSVANCTQDGELSD